MSAREGPIGEAAPDFCPFCGSTDAALGQQFSAAGPSHFVFCRRCGAEGPHLGVVLQSEATAIEQWNLRALPPQAGRH